MRDTVTSDHLALPCSTYRHQLGLQSTGSIISVPTRPGPRAERPADGFAPLMKAAFFRPFRWAISMGAVDRVYWSLLIVQVGVRIRDCRTRPFGWRRRAERRRLPSLQLSLLIGRIQT